MTDDEIREYVRQELDRIMPSVCASLNASIKDVHCQLATGLHEALRTMGARMDDQIDQLRGDPGDWWKR